MPTKATSIQQRLIRFAIDVVRLAGRLPRTIEGRHIGTQVLRSGTSPAANYAEACAAESRKDFIHKLRIALKELAETGVWLQVLEGSGIHVTDETTRLSAECDELARIIGASISTASRARPNSQ